ncbi:unnamed protein product [Paramecium sonneborni]|uniref:Uncharacterized protein n=1 Tax=Paramecium sonneborni TaxID=65129 RepID=A0A8S1RUB2_9CILI|nr:unnamed protein product [Paramecium sonneborni]
MRKEKILDNLQFISYIHFITIQLQTRGNINHYQQKISDVIKKEITKITNFLREVQDYPYSKKDYSTKAYEKETKNIIKKVAENKGIINFKKILELLTSIDEKYIQCGLKGVLMKVDVTNRNFEGISMKNTSLIGVYLIRCNISGSK